MQAHASRAHLPESVGLGLCKPSVQGTLTCVRTIQTAVPCHHTSFWNVQHVKCSGVTGCNTKHVCPGDCRMALQRAPTDVFSSTALCTVCCW